MRIYCAVLGLCLSCVQLATAAEVSLPTLLDEMTDRAVLARFPEPAYTCAQSSSYNREAKSPDRSGWFANRDWSHFLRKETNNGRTEWVMMDAEGPGAIVRWWITGRKFKGSIRIYLDDAKEPQIEMRADQLVGGDGLVGEPFSAERAGGRNLYLPIPYAKRFKVTFDRNFYETKNREDRLFYQINYRTYPPGTPVETFSLAGLEAEKDRIAAIGETLLDPDPPLPDASSEASSVVDRKVRIEPGQAAEIGIDKSGAICELSVRLDANDPVQALRSTVLVVEFDGEQTVWCPVGDFFGSGVGVNPYKDWYRRVDQDGTMTCRWIMPFEKECKLSLKNLGNQVVEGAVSIATGDWSWDDRSMHFHANWRQQRDMKTKAPHFDWRYLTAQGKGVFVGDTLALVNRSEVWWGEGDEKIFVDGEAFPSHFGTGTEDYYGYAWGMPTFFDSPFHAQPRAEGPKQRGNVTNTRVRLLDAIPFSESFQFDMEVWHIAKTTVDYAATTYWYGRPGAKAAVGPMPDEASQPVRYHTK